MEIRKAKHSINSKCIDTNSTANIIHNINFN